MRGLGGERGIKDHNDITLPKINIAITLYCLLPPFSMPIYGDKKILWSYKIQSDRQKQKMGNLYLAITIEWVTYKVLALLIVVVEVIVAVRVMVILSVKFVKIIM